MAFVLFQHQQKGFCFFPTSTNVFFIWYQQHCFCFVMVNNTAFVLFQCQQHCCQNWQQLVRQGEVAWLLERLRKTSYARVTLIKFQQKHGLTQWQNIQGKAMIGLKSDEVTIPLSCNTYAYGKWARTVAIRQYCHIRSHIFPVYGRRHWILSPRRRARLPRGLTCKPLGNRFKMVGI